MISSKLLKDLHNFILWQKIKLRNNKSLLEKVYSNWLQNGMVIPPPHIVKQKVIEEYQNKFAVNVLVETGTFMGEMLYAQRKNFKSIYSIELSKELYETAEQRLKKYKHIKLLMGDSGEVLKILLPEIKEQAIFWLDGHYSGFETAKGKLETPVKLELELILGSEFNHIILIDDARLFIGKNDYPTIEELKDYILRKNNSLTVDIMNDIIRIYKE